MNDDVQNISKDDVSVHKENGNISELISLILNKKDDILEDHSIDDTAHKLGNFESLIKTFDKYDRRKEESEESREKFKTKRDSEKNSLIATLLDTMRNKIDFFEQEMNIAREIQKNMVPREMPIADGFDIQGFYQPSRQVGGDYYDMFATNDGMLYFVMSDVSGKGLPSSLVVASMQAYISAGVKNRKPLPDLLHELNNFLTEKLIAEKYVTFFMGVLNLNDGYLQYINAGHNPPYIIKNNGSDIIELCNGGPILGMFEDISYITGSAMLSSGDSLALFTDGVVEAFNMHEEEFSEERLIEILKRENSRPMKEVIVTIYRELKSFCGECPFGDDITMLLIKKI